MKLDYDIIMLGVGNELRSPRRSKKKQNKKCYLYFAARVQCRSLRCLSPLAKVQNSRGSTRLMARSWAGPDSPQPRTVSGASLPMRKCTFGKNAAHDPAGQEVVCSKYREPCLGSGCISKPKMYPTNGSTFVILDQKCIYCSIRYCYMPGTYLVALRICVLDVPLQFSSRSAASSYANTSFICFWSPGIGM